MANNQYDNFIDGNGLLYFWQRLKSVFVTQVSGKDLSTNDYTTDEKNKLAGIAAGATKVTVTNSLTSTSTANALSANQGKVLDEKIKALSDSMGDLGYGDMMKQTYDQDNDGVIDNAAKLGGQFPSYYATASGLAEKVDKVSGKGLSTNDYTTTEKTKLSGIESGAEVNIVETIKVNGTAVAVSSKAVNIPVPTKVSQLSDAANYALKSDLTNVYIYQGQVNTFADLPATSTVGYVYDVKEDGMNYAWNGTTWDNLGQIFTISALTNAEIDAIMAT